MSILVEGRTQLATTPPRCPLTFFYIFASRFPFASAMARRGAQASGPQVLDFGPFDIDDADLEMAQKMVLAGTML